MLANLSIRTRLLLLSCMLISMIVMSTYYLTSKLTQSSNIINRNAELTELIDTAQDVRNAFGDYRYWLADLAVSLLRQSEINADQTRERLVKHLEELDRQRPDIASVLKHEIAAFDASARRAVEQYTEDQRVLANISVSEARQHSIIVNDRLQALIDDLNTQVSQAREQVVADADRTRQLAYLIVAIAIVLGIGVTLVILRSILIPLHDLVGAMEGITAGNLSTPIPQQSGGELGTMARTLQHFRSSIAERERLSRETDRQRRMIETAIETISDGFVLYDAADRMVMCNTKFRELYPELADILIPGTEFKSILRTLLERDMIDLSEQTAEQWLAARLARHANPRGSFEYRHNEVWARISERKTLDGSTVGVFTDISELKTQQADLERATREADAANQSKSVFLANMSHELRTPLNAIIGYSEMLHEIAVEQGNSEFSEDLAKIQAAGRHLLSLISDILDLSKVEAGKTEVYFEDVDVRDLVDEVRTIIDALTTKNGNSLVVECPPSLGMLRTDRTKLKQILINLLSNAIKFTSNGTVSLNLEEASLATGRAIRFSVKDNGIGMTPAQKEKLFQPFGQADASTTRRYGGTGLGLAITKRFCEILDGTISVVSNPGEGSTFIVTLPDQGVAEILATPAKSMQAEDHHAPLVMVVDDDAAARGILSAVLRKDGLRVIEAESGEAALALARTKKPDAITLDVMMPRMDGWAVLTALKSDAELASIPVVIVTITTDRGIALSLGATDFMTKPVDRGRLLSVLDTILHGRGSVLLVDDESNARELAKRQLQSAGVDVSEASNGREALDWLTKNPAPGLILLDLVMPDMDGFSTLAALEDNPAWRDIPVVILTAKDLNRQEKMLLQGRAENVIAKGSTSAKDLASIVRRTLRRHGVTDKAPGNSGK